MLWYLGKRADHLNSVVQEGLPEEMSGDLNKEERTMWTCRRRTSQAKSAASAKVLRQDRLACPRGGQYGCSG